MEIEGDDIEKLIQNQEDLEKELEDSKFNKVSSVH